jgi:hypothetical protein
MDAQGVIPATPHLESDNDGASRTGRVSLASMITTPGLYPLDMLLAGIEPGVPAEPLVLAVPVAGLPTFGLRAEVLVFCMPEVRHELVQTMSAYSPMTPTHGSPPGCQG